jgi:hypothetical protein
VENCPLLNMNQILPGVMTLGGGRVTRQAVDVEHDGAL